MTTGSAEGSAGYVLVVTDHASRASDALFFEHLADRLPSQVRIARAGHESLAGPLAGASAVILVRSLIELKTVSACAKRLGVPVYFFLDDNFMLLREGPDPYATWFAAYSDDGVRVALRDFSGVLLATPALVDYFRAHHLHAHLTLFPPVAGRAPGRPARAAGHPLTVAFFGGSHRRDAFVQLVYPAVRRAAEGRDIVLVAVGIDRALAPSEGRLRVVHEPYDPSYADALQQVAGHGVDILVHPGSPSVNNPYKNPHVLINAWMLGAAPIFSDLPPYDAVAAERVAVVCANSVEDWYRAVATLARDAAERRALIERLATYCDAHFGGRVNESVIASMLGTHAAPTMSQLRRRRVSGAVCLGLGRLTGLTRRAIRRARRSRDRTMSGAPDRPR